MAGYYYWSFINVFMIVAAHEHTTTFLNMTTDGRYGVTTPEHCVVKFSDADIKRYREHTSDDDTKLVYVHFHFTSHPGKLMFEDQEELSEPLTLLYVSDHQGKMLLNLLQQFEALSLQTMSIGVEHVTIQITESPAGCLTNQPMDIVKYYFRDTLLKDFGSSVKVKSNKSSDSSMDEQTGEPIGVCHMTIGKEGNLARFFYMCCHSNESELAVCEELKVNYYMEVVKCFILITNILTIVFCPYFIPESFYSDSNGRVSYEQDTKTERESVTILKVNVPKKYRYGIQERFVTKYMPKLKKTVKALKKGKPYECDVGTIKFSVKTRDLISESDVPVGIFSTLYNNFARCEVRNHSSVKDCCSADLVRIFGCSINWYDCLSRLMKTIVLITILIPWLVRVVFYVSYERDHLEMLAAAAKSRQLRLPYLANLSLYLSPMHVLFIICYLFIVIEGMCLGILHRNTTRSLRIAFRKCFIDMRRSSRFTSVGKLWKSLLLPCTKYGIFGLILFPIVWVGIIPLALIIATFKCLPIVNLTLRLIETLLYNGCPAGVGKMCYSPDPEDSEEIRGDKKCLVKVRQMVTTLFCLLALYSFLLLLVEFIQFIVVIVIYTLMGMILNSSIIMQYVPLVFMLGVYGNRTFKGVYRKYMCFNKIVHKYVLDIFKSTSSEAERDLMHSQANTAFKVGHWISSKDSVYVKNSIIKWLSRRTVLFVDKYGTRYIRKGFFFQCCNMDHFAAPGNLASNLKKAVLKFMATLAFLAFVGYVVLAFSENFKLSSTNQTIIALAGGLIPFLLTNFLFKGEALPEVEEDDVRFTRNLFKIISNYEETFDIVDFACLNVRRLYTRATAQRRNKNSSIANLNMIAPKRAGTNDHVINLNVPSPDLDTNKYADDSEDISGTGQISNKPASTGDGEQTEIPNVIEEITNEQTRELPLPSDQQTRDEKSSHHVPSPSSSSANSEETRPSRDLGNYDIVINTNQSVTTAQYLVSLI